MDKAFITDIAKLPRTSRARRCFDGSNLEMCICCGQPVAANSWWVVTEQGEYPVGNECAKKCTKAGFELVPADE